MTFTILCIVINIFNAAVFGFRITTETILESGCSIVELNNYYLVSYFHVTGDLFLTGDRRPGFLAVDSAANVDVNKLNDHDSQGSETVHPMACSLYDNTLVAYTYSMDNIIWLDFITETDGTFSRGYFTLTDGTQFSQDATIMPEPEIIDESTEAFIIVWSHSATRSGPYSLYARVIWATSTNSVQWTDNFQFDENIHSIDQLNSKIIQSESGSILTVWREHNVIYGKILVSDILDSINVDKFEIVAFGNSTDTELEIYQVIALSTDGFIVLFDNDLTHNNCFYFVVLDHNGVNVYNEIFNVTSPFNHESGPNWISFVQMVEIPMIQTDDNYYSTYIKFIYSKYSNIASNEITRFYLSDWFFHLDFENQIFLYEKDYYDQHYLFYTFNDVGACIVKCTYYDQNQRKLCAHINPVKDEYLFVGETQHGYGGKLDGAFGSFTDYYNCISTIDKTSHVCDGNVTYVLQGCYNIYPYYYGQINNKFMYFNRETNQYIISEQFVNQIPSEINSEILMCNVSNINAFTNIMKCNGHWYSNINGQMESVTLVVDVGCSTQHPFTTQTTVDMPTTTLNTFTTQQTTSTQQLTTIPSYVSTASTPTTVSAEQQTLTTQTPLTTLIPSDTDDVSEAAANITSDTMTRTTLVIIIVVVVIFVVVILVGIIVYVVKRKPFATKESAQTHTNDVHDINEEQVKLKVHANSPKVLAETDENVEF